MSEQLDSFLNKPTPPPLKLVAQDGVLTSEVTITGDIAEVVVNNARPRPEPDVEGHETLRKHGLSPAEWEATAFSTSEWTMGNGEQGLSTRYSYRRTVEERPAPPGPPLDDLFAALAARPTPVHRPIAGTYGYIVAIGDMQFGKIDGDGAAGTLERTVRCLEAARANLDRVRGQYDIGHVHIAWLGDHVEGFVSQNGANIWRTPLTLNEQIRLTRRVMLYALQLFADSPVEHLTMAAVPGNHGEPQRFAGKGQTRYDDSHDTESLIAVSEAAALNHEAFGHVKFFVPETDELTVTVNVAGTTVSHAHGNQWRVGKQFDWWSGQAFGGSPLRDADLLLAGHFHSLYVDTDGRRMSVQVPALESESTWWRHKTGTPGDPGIVTLLTRNGSTSSLEVVR